MISIIIPTLNEEKILKKSLENFTSDFTLPHEIILSDGKSTDTTIQIAQAFGDKVKIVEYAGSARQTIAQGRNDGAKASSGEFLVFMDADCFILHKDEFFTKALEKFERDPMLVAFTAYLAVLPEYATFIDKIMSGVVSYTYKFINNVLHIGASSGEFQMMRRDAFFKVNGFNEKLVTGEDIDMFKRLSKIGKTRLFSDLVVHHTGRRIHHLGWPRLLFQWFKSTASTVFLGKSSYEEWKVIR